MAKTIKVASLKALKQMAKAEGKRIGGEALEKASSLLEEQARLLMKKAASNAMCMGRVTIKEEDFEE
ncbi:MAG: hypothetical protein KJ955_00845 [Nanoarchaeota archaeon]|nr:hypothetical protein [Nanoarchaeota archaeon]